MTTSVRESQLVTELATLLYDFLPGKPFPRADQSLSFPGAAEAAGVGRHWGGGSKGPAIGTLLGSTLQHDRQRFCALLVQIVTKSMSHRARKSPLTRDEIDKLNGIVAEIGFKVPELHDPKFLNSLPRSSSIGKSAVWGATGIDDRARGSLEGEFRRVTSLAPTERGYAFEGFLNDLFRAYGLAPREPFRNRGEQIDGSFALDEQVYLLEAKWEAGQIGQGPLLEFDGKVGGKAEWARGVFISISGFTDAGLDAFRQGRRTKIVGMDALDLHHILAGRLDLREVIRAKVRRAGETNRAFVPVRDLFPTVT